MNRFNILGGQFGTSTDLDSTVSPLLQVFPHLNAKTRVRFTALSVAAKEQKPLKHPND